MTRAVIDLGTNTVLMTIGRRNDQSGAETTILADEQRVGRLGKGVDANGVIDNDTFDRIGSIIAEYVAIARSFGAESIECVSTSALRDAANRDSFVDYMRTRTGVDIAMISGDVEAELTWLGALSGLDVGDSEVVVIDIGGGSTEIAGGKEGIYDDGVSVDIGAVRITERHFSHGLPPSDDEIASATDDIVRALQPVREMQAGGTVVGVAGTVTTLAAMWEGMVTYAADQIHGLILDAEWIASTSSRLLGMAVAELRRVPGMDPGRVDIIGAGSLILTTLLDVLQASDLIVSARGLRYGLLERSFQTSAPGR